MIADRKMRVGGFFTGIGAHHSALERIKARTPGFDYEVVFQGEIDAKTALAYDTIHGPTANLGDITKVESLDEYRLDLFMVSPPCQDISVAGLGKGATEGSGTRSSLIYEVPRILAATARDRLPEFVVWEDVPNLVSSKFIWVWEDVLARMEAIGYRTVWQVMNAADYGVAQSRKRLFAVSRLDKDPPAMPKPFPLEKRLRDYLEPEPVADCYYLSEDRLNGLVWSNEKERDAGGGFRFKPSDGSEVGRTVTSRAGGRKTDNYVLTGGGWSDDSRCVARAPLRGGFAGRERVYGDGCVCPTICSHAFKGDPPSVVVGGGGDEMEIITQTKSGHMTARAGDGIVLNFVGRCRGTVRHGLAPTLQTDGGGSSGVAVKRICKEEQQMEEMKEGENLTIRKLTERECMRLMDYSDEEIDRLTEAVDARGRRVFSKSAIYRFAGNSIVVGCLEGVLEGCVAEWGEAPLKKGLDRWL